MKCKSLLFIVLVIAGLAACAPPTTPTPQTATPAVTGPTVQPTLNFRATEALIVAHVFATLTASAPTPVPPPPVQPTAARVAPTAAPKAKATPKPTNTVPAPAATAAPKATLDPFLSQIPKGMGGLVVANYIGDHDATVTIAGQTKMVKSNEKALFVLVPGNYSFSISVPGVTGIVIPPLNGVQLPPTNGSSWSDSRDIAADQYFLYPLALSLNP